MNNDLLPRIEVAESLISTIQQKIIEFYNKTQVQIDKSETDFALEADIVVEEIIKNQISSQFPQDGFIAEESGITDNRSDYTWIIDPIDGTANFKAQIPYFCTTISIQHSGELVYSLVYEPINNNIYHAQKQHGAYLNNKPIKVSQESILRKALVSYSTSNHKNERAIELGSKIFIASLKSCRAVRLQGSSILDLCYLASGKFDALVKVQANYWDFASGSLIVEEAGGKVSSMDLRSWQESNVIDIFATNSILHEDFYSQIIKPNY